MAETERNNAAGFRARAEDFLKQANAASDNATRSHYLDLASQWMELAKQLEEWEKKHPQ